MKKYYLLLLWGIILANTAHAQKLSATLDVARFKIDEKQNLVEVDLRFDANSVKFSPNAQKKWQAKVDVTLLLQDSSKTWFADKFQLLSPAFADTNAYKGSQLSTYKRISLPNGKYTLFLIARDPQNPDTAALRATMPVIAVFDENKIQLSDMQLLASYSKAEAKSSLVKHGMEVSLAPSNFYPTNINQIKIFAELYNTQKILGDTASLAVSYRISRNKSGKTVENFGKISAQKAQPVNVLFATVDISQLPSGNYDIVIEAVNKEGKIVARKSKFFQRSNPKADAGIDIASGERSTFDDNFAMQLKPEDLKKYIRALEPICNKQEISSIIALSKNGNVTAQQNYLHDFWKRRNAQNPAKAFKEYAELLELAEETYSTRTLRAYQTDRGRVFLQHGKPNQIENEYTDRKRSSHLELSSLTPYEIWYYYNIEENNQNNVEFVFAQSNLGNNNYKQIHSTALGEFRNVDWREAIAKKAKDGNNLDYMNPAK